LRASSFFGDVFDVEEFEALRDGEIEHFGDGFALVFVFQHFGLEALALADVAGQFGVVEEGEVGGDKAGAFAVVAGPF